MANMQQMQMQPNMHSHNPLSTTKCIYCMTQLSYPANSVYIQCPKCGNTMNPQSTTNYINCVGCGTLLSHSPTSLTIQCPRCLIIMELPTRLNAAPPADPGGQAAKGGNIAMKQPLKKRKDPNAPKRASNAYMIFCKERRSKLREERPDLPFGKIGAKLGEIWRTMSADEKRPYEERAANDRERYKDELGNYQPGPGDDAQPAMKKQATPTSKLMMSMPQSGGKASPDVSLGAGALSGGILSPGFPGGVPNALGTQLPSPSGLPVMNNGDLPVPVSGQQPQPMAMTPLAPSHSAPIQPQQTPAAVDTLTSAAQPTPQPVVPKEEPPMPSPAADSADAGPPPAAASS